MVFTVCEVRGGRETETEAKTETELGLELKI